MTDETYSMSVDLSVLESLGINLYSNAAAVLSELVANGHDADATRIKIDWKGNGSSVVVTDNGVGMTVAELNNRFLKVGYKKRASEGSKSKKWKRPFMGRKGIGKLSVFSIAETVTVYSTKEGEPSHGFVIVVGDLETSIKNNSPYHPQPVDVPEEFAKPGTTILLTDLKSKRAALTAAALRKRLARRFDVIGQSPESKGGFFIEVNTKEITYADRQELKKLEFIWEFGSTTLPDSVLPKGIGRFVLPSDTVDVKRGWKVSGWIGTAHKSTDLTSDDEAGSLKNVIVLARKRPIQEGIIEKLDFTRLFGNYVTGQIEADFLDMDEGYEDIATSDRQRLIEDDERVLALQTFLRQAFLRAADEWSKHRPKKDAKNALDAYPALRTWLDDRPSYQKPAAEKMIETIASLSLVKRSEGDRSGLFRAGVLAFERLGLRESTEELDQLSGLAAEDLLPLLGAQGAYESALWIDILRSRVEAIEKFRDLTDSDEKEKVLQQYLHKHLWLLDPSWERATGSETMEQDLRRIEPGLFAVDESGQRLYGRTDIRYASAVGQHVIVELKRYSVSVDVEVLYDQGLKYFTALRSVLGQQQLPTNQVEIVFVLGDHPKAASRGRKSVEDYIADRLDPINGRYVLYNELIGNAQRQYSNYLEASEDARALDDLLKMLDDDEIVDD